MMEHQLEQIREQQRASWNKFSPGWKKWDSLFMNFLEPMGREIIQSLKLKETDLVLDVASGTGEPGLTIASSLKKGNVVITDLAEDMLDIAKENALIRGIKNVETAVCDVTEMPFADNQFDAISCRFGFMFFPDMQLAANEIARVVKPGGRVAASVWNVAEKNFWITAMMGSIQKYIEMPTPQPGAPGMFRCSKEGLMADIFKNAGLKKVTVKEVPGKLNCQTAETYWNVMTELAAPVVTALDKVDYLTGLKVKNEVLQVINQKFAPGQVQIQSSALIISAEK